MVVTCLLPFSFLFFSFLFFSFLFFSFLFFSFLFFFFFVPGQRTGKWRGTALKNVPASTKSFCSACEHCFFESVRSCLYSAFWKNWAPIFKPAFWQAVLFLCSFLKKIIITRFRLLLHFFNRHWSGPLCIHRVGRKGGFDVQWFFFVCRVEHQDKGDVRGHRQVGSEAFFLLE